MNSGWHVWTIIGARWEKVCEFLSEFEKVEDFVYPTVKKDYATKSGWKSKDVPLYSNYVFIKYNHTNKAYTELQEYPWIRDYVGPCSPKEMKEVQKLSKMKYEDVIPASEAHVDMVVKLTGTPFKGMTCVIKEIEGDKLMVSVMIFGAERLVKCGIDDIDLEG